MLDHVIPHFVDIRAYGRAQPGKQVCRRAIKRLDGFLENTARQPAPAGVNGGDGAGADCPVYMAEQEHPVRRKVALKVLPQEMAEDPDQAAQREYREQSGGVEPGATQDTVEPIQNVGPKVGRNDPCPCGSGKEYKVCCGR